MATTDRFRRKRADRVKAGETVLLGTVAQIVAECDAEFTTYCGGPAVAIFHRVPYYGVRPYVVPVGSMVRVQAKAADA